MDLLQLVHYVKLQLLILCLNKNLLKQKRKWLLSNLKQMGGKDESSEEILKGVIFPFL